MRHSTSVGTSVLVCITAWFKPGICSCTGTCCCGHTRAHNEQPPKHKSAQWAVTKTQERTIDGWGERSLAQCGNRCWQNWTLVYTTNTLLSFSKTKTSVAACAFVREYFVARLIENPYVLCVLGANTGPLYDQLLVAELHAVQSRARLKNITFNDKRSLWFTTSTQVTILHYVASTHYHSLLFNCKYRIATPKRHYIFATEHDYM